MNGYNNQFDGAYGYYPQPRKPFRQRLRENPDYGGYKKLFLIGFLAGLGFIMYPCLSNIYSFVLVNNKELYQMYTGDYNFQLLCEMIYSFVCVGFPFLLVSILMRTSGAHTQPLPYNRPYSYKSAAVLVFAGLGLCFIGSLVSSYFSAYADAMGVKFYSYEAATTLTNLPETPLTVILLIFHSGIIPALIEEFVFRGIILQSLRRYGDWFAIIVSAVMFGLMHANMLQVPFAMIAGIALGYCTVVTGSMWTGVIIHLLNNLVSVAYSVIVANGGQSAGLTFSSAATYSFIGIGVVAFLIFVSRNRNFMRLRPGVYRYIRHPAAAFFLSPTMIAGILWLLALTLTDIVGFSEFFAPVV